MSRRCLICANINPCREHSGSEQDAELSRNQRAIANYSGLQEKIRALAAAPQSPPVVDAGGLADKLSKIDAALSASPWDVWRERTDTRDAAVSEMIEQVHSSEPFAGAVFLLNAGGKCPATTGCGPTSEANANGLAELRNMLPDLIAAAEALTQAQARVAELEQERDFLLARAGHAGSVRFGGKDRWTGASSNVLVTIAFGGEVGKYPDHPFDSSDLAACYRTILRLPVHRRTQAVFDQLKLGEAFVGAEAEARARKAANWPGEKLARATLSRSDKDNTDAG